MALWRLYPGEIASDLSQYHHRRIADWHQGTMLSYELLELCEYMDDDGRLKTAMRQGEASEHRQAVFAAANETAVLRAGMVPNADSQDWGGRLFLPAYKLREAAAGVEENTEAREAVFAMADMTGQEE
jgi:hypothetical protein